MIKSGDSCEMLKCDCGGVGADPELVVQYCTYVGAAGFGFRGRAMFSCSILVVAVIWLRIVVEVGSLRECLYRQLVA